VFERRFDRAFRTRSVVHHTGYPSNEKIQNVSKTATLAGDLRAAERRVNHTSVDCFAPVNTLFKYISLEVFRMAGWAGGAVVPITAYVAILTIKLFVLNRR